MFQCKTFEVRHLNFLLSSTNPIIGNMLLRVFSKDLLIKGGNIERFIEMG